MNKTKSIQATKNDQYYRLEHEGRVLGVYWQLSEGGWLVQSWGGNLDESVIVNSTREAIALLEESWGVSSS